MVIGKVTTNKNAAHLLQFSKVHFILEWFFEKVTTLFTNKNTAHLLQFSKVHIISECFLKCNLTTLFADNESGFSVTFKRLFKTSKETNHI